MAIRKLSEVKTKPAPIFIEGIGYLHPLPIGADVPPFKGRQFGRLTAVECVGSARGQRVWSVRCDCGTETYATTTRLIGGTKASCGCDSDRKPSGVHAAESASNPVWRALSVRQPWAYAIMHLGKPVENRGWRTSFRGRIALHASAHTGQQEYGEAREAIFDITAALIPPYEQMGLGAIVGTVEISDCVSEMASPWFFGLYGFVLKDAVPFKTPIPVKGALGFWEVPEGMLVGFCHRCGRSREQHYSSVKACERFMEAS